MGTGSSSKGPPSSGPLIPPWTPDPPHPNEGADSDDNENQNQSSNSTSNLQSVPDAPPARFRPARTNLGSFANFGSKNDMMRSLGHYVRKGYGGSNIATRRMGRTVQTAGNLFNVLSSLESGKAIELDSVINRENLAGKSADEVMDALVEVVRPIDGTQDTEVSRRAVRNALSDLLNRYPDTDLLSLSWDQTLYTIECFISLDVFYQFELDLSKTIQENAPSARIALSRLKEIKDFVQQTISREFRELSKASEQFDDWKISEITSKTLRITFEIFEDFVQ